MPLSRARELALKRISEHEREIVEEERKAAATVIGFANATQATANDTQAEPKPSVEGEASPSLSGSAPWENWYHQRAATAVAAANAKAAADEVAEERADLEAQRKGVAQMVTGPRKNAAMARLAEHARQLAEHEEEAQKLAADAVQHQSTQPATKPPGASLPPSAWISQQEDTWNERSDTEGRFAQSHWGTFGKKLFGNGKKLFGNLKRKAVTIKRKAMGAVNRTIGSVKRKVKGAVNAVKRRVRGAVKGTKKPRAKKSGLLRYLTTWRRRRTQPRRKRGGYGRPGRSPRGQRKRTQPRRKRSGYGRPRRSRRGRRVGDVGGARGRQRSWGYWRRRRTQRGARRSGFGRGSRWRRRRTRGAGRRVRGYRHTRVRDDRRSHHRHAYERGPWPAEEELKRLRIENEKEVERATQHAKRLRIENEKKVERATRHALDWRERRGEEIGAGRYKERAQAAIKDLTHDLNHRRGYWEHKAKEGGRKAAKDEAVKVEKKEASREEKGVKKTEKKDGKEERQAEKREGTHKGKNHGSAKGSLWGAAGASAPTEKSQAYRQGYREAMRDAHAWPEKGAHSASPPHARWDRFPQGSWGPPSVPRHVWESAVVKAFGTEALRRTRPTQFVADVGRRAVSLATLEKVWSFLTDITTYSGGHLVNYDPIYGLSCAKDRTRFCVKGKDAMCGSGDRCSSKPHWEPLDQINMHTVAAQLVLPLTIKAKASFAETLGGKAPNHFVSQNQAGSFLEFLNAVRSHFATLKRAGNGATKSNTFYWVNTFAVNLHMISPEVGTSPDRSLFAKAIDAVKEAKGVLLSVQDDKSALEKFSLSRGWCVFQMNYALLKGVPVMYACGNGALMSFAGHYLTTQRCSCDFTKLLKSFRMDQCQTSHTQDMVEILNNIDRHSTCTRDGEAGTTGGKQCLEHKIRNIELHNGGCQVNTSPRKWQLKFRAQPKVVNGKVCLGHPHC